MGLTGIPNCRHYILKRLPDAPDGRVNWILSQEPGEANLPRVHISWDYSKIRKMVSEMKIGETKTLLAHH